MIKIPAKELVNKPGRSRKLLYVIVTCAVGEYIKMQEMRAAHLEYLHQLDESGCLVGAGPTLDGRAEFYEGDGIIIVKAESAEAAAEIADADPFYQYSIRKYHIKPWLLSEGALTLL